MSTILILNGKSYTKSLNFPEGVFPVTYSLCQDIQQHAEFSALAITVGMFSKISFKCEWLRSGGESVSHIQSAAVSLLKIIL
jgi:hypothetical protein